MSLTGLMGGRKGGQLSVMANGPRFVELRLALNQKQCFTEEDAGLKDGQLSRYETSKPNGIDGLLCMAEYYGVPPRQLIHPASIGILEALLAKINTALGNE